MPAPPLDELVAPDRTALVLQEVQRGVVGENARLRDLAAASRSVGLVDKAIALASAARTAGVPVVHCTATHLPGNFGANRNARLFAGARRLQVTGDPDGLMALPVDGLWNEGDVVLPRFHGLSPMSGTQLDSLLRNAGIATVVVAGVSLNVAIPNLVFDAVNRSYQVVVVEDAVAGVPLEYGRQVLDNTLRLLATIVPAHALVEAWRAR